MTEQAWVPTDGGVTPPLFVDPAVLFDTTAMTRAEVRRAVVQHAIAVGKHPTSGLPLHPDAELEVSPRDRFRRPGTCGNCVHLEAVTTTHARDLDEAPVTSRHLSCDLVVSQSSGRRWLPCCVRYVPLSALSQE